MNICLNMITAGGGRSGVYSYVENMATTFPKLYPKVNFTLFITEDLLGACDTTLKNVDIIICHFAAKSAFKRFLWEQFILPFELKRRSSDIVYTFSVTDIFFSPCPSVVRVGNMLPYSKEAMKYQNGLKSKFRLNYLRYMTRLSSYTSDAILVMSEAGARILVTESGYPKDKTHGVNRGASFDAIKKDSSPLENLPHKYILVFSHIQEHKNFEQIINGYSLVKPEIPLLIVGAKSNSHYQNRLEKLVEELGLINDVIFFGRVDQTKLFQIMKPAEIIIFPSLVETYPSSLIEPMMVGSAMIVSDRSVMPYFCGDSVLYYNPFSAKELAKQLQALLSSDSLRARYKEKTKKRMNEIDISWDDAINKRYDLFKKIINK